MTEIITSILYALNLAIAVGGILCGVVIVQEHRAKKRERERVRRILNRDESE